MLHLYRFSLRKTARRLGNCNTYQSSEFARSTQFISLLLALEECKCEGGIFCLLISEDYWLIEDKKWWRWLAVENHPDDAKASGRLPIATA